MTNIKDTTHICLQSKNVVEETNYLVIEMKLNFDDIMTI